MMSNDLLMNFCKNRNLKFTTVKTYSAGIRKYESFHNMCENIINYCNFWANKLKPRFLFIKNEKYKLYIAFSEAASYVVNELNYMIEAYIGAESHISEQIQKQSEIEERIRIERSVHELINKEQENLEKKKSKPIGFIRYASKKRTKRKVNKTKDTND